MGKTVGYAVAAPTLQKKFAWQPTHQEYFHLYYSEKRFIFISRKIPNSMNRRKT